MSSAAPKPLRTLIERYDEAVFDARHRPARVRLDAGEDGAWDAVLENGRVALARADGRPDATLAADLKTWETVAADVRGGMEAFEAGKLTIRRDLHLGVGFLAATSGMTEPGRLTFRNVETRVGTLSVVQAGEGVPVLAIHGLGATKASFLPTLAALADDFAVTALDLPGFGDSDKPLGARYDARFFADAVVALMDALEIDRAHLVGNSLGGRVSLEVALVHPERVRRLALLAPSMAWRRRRPWAPLLRLVRPELGVVQPAPRRVVERITSAVVPGGRDGWAAAGVDEFLRAYLTPAGRAAFYAAARQIYLEEPEGENGFWPRLRTLERPALFVWGKSDTLVPIAFARHVTEALPTAEHLELDCGHVPQLERPKRTHGVVRRFLSEDG